MKTKYVAAVLLAAASASSVLAYQLASAEERTLREWRPDQDSQLQSLDARLGEKVSEFLELSELLSRQLDSMNLKRALQQDTPLLTDNVTSMTPPSVEPTPASRSGQAPMPIAEQAPAEWTPTARASAEREPAERASVERASAERTPAERASAERVSGTEPPVALPIVQVPERAIRQAPWWSRYRLSMVVHSDDVHSAVINGQYVRTGDTLAPGVVVRRIVPGQVTLARRGATARLTIEAQ